MGILSVTYSSSKPRKNKKKIDVFLILCFDCCSPEQLWILNPKRILKKDEVNLKHRVIPKDDTPERDFADSGECSVLLNSNFSEQIGILLICFFEFQMRHHPCPKIAGFAMIVIEQMQAHLFNHVIVAVM